MFGDFTLKPDIVRHLYCAIGFQDVDKATSHALKVMFFFDHRFEDVVLSVNNFTVGVWMFGFVLPEGATIAQTFTQHLLWKTQVQVVIVDVDWLSAD